MNPLAATDRPSLQGGATDQWRCPMQWGVLRTSRAQKEIRLGQAAFHVAWNSSNQW
jgi:hypothetical protein